MILWVTCKYYAFYIRDLSICGVCCLPVVLEPILCGCTRGLHFCVRYRSDTMNISEDYSLWINIDLQRRAWGSKVFVF
jgi:hypothetical protein